jgi:SUMO ligase MMS21 Smc5/6 complex component
MMAPCPIIDHPHQLRTIVLESGAQPTHEGAEDVLNGKTAKFLDNLSYNWREMSTPINNERIKKAEDSQEKDRKQEDVLIRAKDRII